MKNIYTLLFIFSLYLLFVLVFNDVLRDREFNIGLTMTSIIVLAILFFAWINRVFFNVIENDISNNNILLIIVASIVLSLFIQKLIYIEDKSSNLNYNKNINPLYEEFKKIAIDNNLDLSFTQTVWTYNDRYNYKSNAIFKEKPKSIDILFIGDSSISWGLIPKVIEQMTGKKVAMYAYEATFLNKKSSTLFNALSTYYLKEDGIVIFAFDNWTKLKKPNEMDPRFNKYKDVLTWKIEDVQKFASKHEKTFYERYLSFDVYQTKYKEISEYAKNNYHLSLKSISFYEKYLEQLINKKWLADKSLNKQDKANAICWDDISITLYGKDYKHKSIHSDTLSDKNFNNEEAKMNALSASRIYGKKIYMVPLYYYNQAYKDSRSIYYKYYQDLGFELCDLGQYHPKNDAYTMQDGPHMANTGGLKQSILIGKWLKEYFNDHGI